MRKIAFLFLISLSFVTILSCSKKKSDEKVADTNQNDKQYEQAVDFTLKDLQEKTYQLSDLKGKVVYLNFWATWCSPCIQEIPELVEIHQEFKNQGFEILGLTVQGSDKEKAYQLMKEYKIPYPLLWGNDSDVGERYKIRVMPTSFVVDREGRIHQQIIGVTKNQKERIENAIKEVL